MSAEANADHVVFVNAGEQLLQPRGMLTLVALSGLSAARLPFITMTLSNPSRFNSAASSSTSFSGHFRSMNPRFCNDSPPPRVPLASARLLQPARREISQVIAVTASAVAIRRMPLRMKGTLRESPSHFRQTRIEASHVTSG